jgi:hypothetical protein
VDTTSRPPFAGLAPGPGSGTDVVVDVVVVATQAGEALDSAMAYAARMRPRTLRALHPAPVPPGLAASFWARYGQILEAEAPPARWRRARRPAAGEATSAAGPALTVCVMPPDGRRRPGRSARGHRRENRAAIVVRLLRSAFRSQPDPGAARRHVALVCLPERTEAPADHLVVAARLLAPDEVLLLGDPTDAARAVGGAAVVTLVTGGGRDRRHRWPRHLRQRLGPLKPLLAGRDVAVATVAGRPTRTLPHPPETHRAH